jgi:hypothetical protein
MSKNILPGMHHSHIPITANRAIDIERSQETVYRFLIQLVKTRSPQAVLLEFQNLFFDYNSHPENAEVLKEVADLVAGNYKQEFLHLIKRCCYILVNNWETQRHHEAIEQLIELLTSLDCNKKAKYHVINRLRSWLKIFIESADYNDLKLFVYRHDINTGSGYPNSTSAHWSTRYTSYLLVPQYANASNPHEQREAAKVLSQQLKDKFKFDLAMYTARSQSVAGKDRVQKSPENPTGLGEDVLRLIKKIVAKRGAFSYSNLANIFLNQTKDLSYQQFKDALLNYLIFSVDAQYMGGGLKRQISLKMKEIYPERADLKIDDSLCLRTCNRIFDLLTTETSKEPSELFLYLMLQGNPLTLVIILLKLLLICPNARVHLEKRIAELIQYYMHEPEESCQWAINFFEIFKITFAIYADNDVHYNLIKVRDSLNNETNDEENLDAYRIFSQQRSFLNSVFSKSNTSYPSTESQS